MKIQHNSYTSNWNNSDILNNAEILVLGSFNPYNINGVNADFYYGRKQNFFWKSIAKIKGFEENYFYNELGRKFQIMKDHKFCTMDLISSIEIFGEREIMGSFVQKKIFNEFFDQTLFTSKTKFQNSKIEIIRHCNEEIFELLDKGKIKKIIHTLGNNTIDNNFTTKWKEKKLKTKGFQGFIQEIQKRADFESLSFSPSAKAVRSGGEFYKIKMEDWLEENLNLKQ